MDAVTYPRRYALSAATTTAVTVVPSRRAFATAGSHTSSGMRSERGMVAMSVADNTHVFHVFPSCIVSVPPNDDHVRVGRVPDVARANVGDQSPRRSPEDFAVRNVVVRTRDGYKSSFMHDLIIAQCRYTVKCRWGQT